MSDADPAHPAGRGFAAHTRRWLSELFLVFLGAYAAFWLNNYQGHQQDSRRHDQILAALEHDIAEAIESAKAGSARQAKIVAEFRRALDAGEMPPLSAFNFTSDYSASDMAALLQSGGYQLLDVKTLVALRELESTLRGGLGAIAHFQKLSDELIVPNLDQDISFFYDPATKRLRKRFAAYPEALETVQRFFDEAIKDESELLKQIQTERRRH